MSINTLSKYLIIFLFSVLVVLSILLGIIVAENKALAKDNTRLSEMVALRDKAINEIDLNIKALQEQVSKAESICNDRIRARESILQFLNLKPPENNGGSFSPTVIKSNLNNKVVCYEKSIIAINYINDYWGMFIPHTNGR